MKYVEFMKRVVPMHDDLFDFFYEALPGYEEVGHRRILLGCWGAFQDPDVCNFKYKDMTEWGRAMYVTPGVVVDGKLVTNDLVEINLGIRILLGSSYYDDWEGKEIFVKNDPLGNPVDERHPWNQTPLPKPQKRDFDEQVQLGDVAALVRRQGPPGPRHRRRPDRAALVHGARRPGGHRLHQGDRQQRRRSTCRRRRPSRRSSSSGRSPSGATPSSATGRGPTSRPTPPPAPCTSSTRR